MKNPGIKHISSFPPSEAELLKLFHELETYKIELEMQNVELLQAKEKAESDNILDRIILEHMAEGVNMIRSGDAVIVYANPKFEALFGYEKGELIGKHVSAINAPSDVSPEDKAKDIIRMIGITGYWKGEIQNIKKDGTQFWCIANVSSFEHPQFGNVWISIHQDITESKLAQDALRKSEENLRILSWAVEQSPVSIVITDTEGHIEFVNPKFTKLTGYTLEEVRNKNPRILKTDFTSKEEYSSLWKTIKAGSEWSGEFCNKKKNGELYWESALISPILNEKKQITHFVALKEDITLQKETERIIQSSIIEAEERERLYFSQELHDGIGPLLSAIRMYVQWLGMPNANIPPAEIISDIEGFIEESSRTIHEIAFKLSPHILQKFGLEEALKSYTTRLRESSEIDIRLNTQNLCRFDQISETMAYRVLCECISNTVKHAGATEISIFLCCQKKQLMVEYSDNGKGFDPDKVFSEHKGSGLYNMRSRIQSLNGQIEIISAPGKGMRLNFQMSI